jgi:type III secretion protein L
MMAPDGRERPAPPRMKPTGVVIRAEEARLWSQAASAIEEARLHLERTTAWVQSAHEKAKEQGFQEGWSAGAQEAARLVAMMAAKTDLYARDLERDLPALVLGVLERILGTFDPGEVLSSAVRQAVGKLRTGAEIRVRVSPDRAEDLRRSLDDLSRIGGSPLVRVEADPGLIAGACVLESEFGNVELGIEAQLDALRKGFASAWTKATTASHSPDPPRGDETDRATETSP